VRVVVLSVPGFTILLRWPPLIRIYFNSRHAPVSERPDQEWKPAGDDGAEPIEIQIEAYSAASAAAAMIGTKSETFKLAPPTSAPSTSGTENISAAFDDFTEPP
jgi:hypothetical protein